MSQIAKLSSDPAGIQKVMDLLLDFGVIAVFERHLAKTKLDGAAMSFDGEYAVIGMSIRHDRVDNFWFVLLHELGHVIQHWPRVHGEGIVDEDAGSGEDDVVENEANDCRERDLAQNNMARIDSPLYEVVSGRGILCISARAASSADCRADTSRAGPHGVLRHAGQR